MCNCVDIFSNCKWWWHVPWKSSGDDNIVCCWQNSRCTIFDSVCTASEFHTISLCQEVALSFLINSALIRQWCGGAFVVLGWCSSSSVIPLWGIPSLLILNSKLVVIIGISIVVIRYIFSLRTNFLFNKTYFQLLCGFVIASLIKARGLLVTLLCRRWKIHRAISHYTVTWRALLWHLFWELILFFKVAISCVRYVNGLSPAVLQLIGRQDAECGFLVIVQHGMPIFYLDACTPLLANTRLIWDAPDAGEELYNCVCSLIQRWASLHTCLSHGVIKKCVRTCNGLSCVTLSQSVTYARMSCTPLACCDAHGSCCWSVMLCLRLSHCSCEWVS